MHRSRAGVRLFIFSMSLMVVHPMCADGKVASPSPPKSESSAAISESERPAFPEKKRDYTDIAEEKRRKKDLKTMKETQNESDTAPFTGIPATITAAEPFSTSSEDAASQSLYAPKPQLLDGNVRTSTSSPQEEQTASQEIQALDQHKKEMSLATTKTATAASVPQKSEKNSKTSAPQEDSKSKKTSPLTAPPKDSFVPNLSQMPLDNPQPKLQKNTTPAPEQNTTLSTPEPTVTKTPAKNRPNTTITNDMPEAYEREETSSQNLKSPANNPAPALNDKPGYRSYTITDLSQVDQLNMDCVASVDQDPATGSFIIRVKENCQ